MREIKFRAWDKIEKRMLYSGIHDRNWYATPYNDEKGCHCVKEKHQSDKNTLTLMQYTGLLDKADKEIYEGDVVKFYLFQSPMGNVKEEYNGEIIFEKGSFYTKFFNAWKGDGEGTIDKKLTSYLLNGDGSEIIGNIYENPELLEVQK